MNSTWIKSAIALIVTTTVAVLFSRIALSMYFKTAKQPSEMDRLAIANKLSEPEESFEPTITTNAIDSCMDELGTAEQVCQQALEILLDRYPRINLDMVQWVYIPKFYSCIDITEGIEAKFNYEQQHIEVEFDSFGSLIEAEHERLPISELPPVVKNAFSEYLATNSGKLKTGNKQLSDYKYYELEQTKDNQLLFEFEVDKELDLDVTFNDRGVVELNRCED